MRFPSFWHKQLKGSFLPDLGGPTLSKAKPLEYPADPSEATEIYAKTVLGYALALANVLDTPEVLASADRSTIGSVILEGCYFFMHLTDRYAFAVLGAEGRLPLIEAVLVRILALMLEWIEAIRKREQLSQSEDERLRQLAANAGDNFDAVSREYAPLSADVPRNAPLDTTVVGRYVRRVEHLLKTDPGTQVELNLLFGAVALLKSLNPVGLVTVWKQAAPPSSRAA